MQFCVTFFANLSIRGSFMIIASIGFGYML